MNIIALILYDARNQVLLRYVKIPEEARKQDPSLPEGQWDFFGGQFSGQDPEEAAREFAKEQLNHNPVQIRQVAEQVFTGDEEGVKYVFVEEITDPSSLERSHGDGWGWYPVEEALVMDLADHDKDILRKVKDLL